MSFKVYVGLTLLATETQSTRAVTINATKKKIKILKDFTLKTDLFEARFIILNNLHMSLDC